MDNNKQPKVLPEDFVFRYYTPDDRSEGVGFSKAGQILKSKNRVAIVGKYKDGTLSMAVARTSVQDQFNRKKGRLIAEGRLEKGRIFKQVPLQFCGIHEFVVEAKKIEKEVIADARLV